MSSDTSEPQSAVADADNSNATGTRTRTRTDASATSANPAPTIRGRTPGNRSLAVTGGILGAVLIGLPHRTSMPGWAATVVVILGILIVVAFVGTALRDFFQREP